MSIAPMSVDALVRLRGLLRLNRTKLAEIVNEHLRNAGSIWRFNQRDISRMECGSNRYSERELRKALTALYRSMKIDVEEADGTLAILFVPPGPETPGTAISGVPAA